MSAYPLRINQDHSITIDAHRLLIQLNRHQISARRGAIIDVFPSTGQTPLRIELFGDEGEVKKRIMGIKTDSTPVEAPKPVDTPLYHLLELMVPASEFPAVDASWRQGGKGYGEYKKTLLAAYHATFGEARARYQALQKDPGSVDAVLRAGAERARAVAAAGDIACAPRSIVRWTPRPASFGIG